MYLVYIEYIEGANNLGRDNAEIRQVKFEGDPEHTIRLIKNRFRETFGVIPTVEYQVIDTDCSVMAMIASKTGSRDLPF